MMVCSCSPKKVEIKETAQGEKYCQTCGYWWMPEHGSLKPTDAPRVVVHKFQPLGRNDPCHCGSHKRYKKCCLPKDQAPKVFTPVFH